MTSTLSRPASDAPAQTPGRSPRRIGFGHRLSRWDLKLSPYLYISPFFILFFVVGLFPIAYTAVISFMDWDLVRNSGEFIGFEQYTWVLSNLAHRPRAWDTRPDLRWVIRTAWPAALEVVLVMVAYLVYNDARFGSPWENGYALIPGLLQEAQYAHGFFSVANIPRILYAMTLTVPVQVADFPWIQPQRLGGLSIFLTTPLFVWAIRARRPDWFGVGAWASILLILIPILTHADPGGMQFGFRYAQDLYPILFLLVVRGLRGRISTEAWIAIGLGVLVNVWGMLAAHNDWWA